MGRRDSFQNKVLLFSLGQLFKRTAVNCCQPTLSRGGLWAHWLIKNMWARHQQHPLPSTPCITYSWVSYLKFTPSESSFSEFSLVSVSSRTYKRMVIWDELHPLQLLLRHNWPSSPLTSHIHLWVPSPWASTSTSPGGLSDMMSQTLDPRESEALVAMLLLDHSCSVCPFETTNGGESTKSCLNAFSLC